MLRPAQLARQDCAVLGVFFTPEFLKTIQLRQCGGFVYRGVLEPYNDTYPRIVWDICSCKKLRYMDGTVPKDHEQEIGFKASQIAFDAVDWMGGPALRPKLEQIRTALDGRKRLVFLYWSRQGERTLREVEPHRLLLKANRWYLQGFCLKRQDFRLFNVSRMSELSIGDDAFEPRAVPPAFTPFAEVMSKKTRPIELMIHASALDRMLDYCGGGVHLACGRCALSGIL